MLLGLGLGRRSKRRRGSLWEIGGRFTSGAGSNAEDIPQQHRLPIDARGVSKKQRVEAPFVCITQKGGMVGI